MWIEIWLAEGPLEAPMQSKHGPCQKEPPMKGRRITSFFLAFCFVSSASVVAQPANPSSPGQANCGGLTCSQFSAHAEQIVEILGIKTQVERAMSLKESRSAGSAMGAEELSLRQEISESVMAAAFDVDGVIAEIDQERARIIEVRAYLQGRRDHALNLTNIAGLISGSGVGIAVNALQFSSTTANTGNGIGVGSGIASTILSVIGIRQQRGPARDLGSAPNMLAIPFGRKPVLSSDYPEDVLAYLNSVAPGVAPERGSRLQALIREWVTLGRLDPPETPKGQKKIDLVTASLDPKQKLRIDDLTDRGMMLADVEGNVQLMKRDLAELMRAFRYQPQRQAP